MRHLTSKLSGGSFEKGAVSAAYGYLFNQAVHAASDSGRALRADERDFYSKYFASDVLSRARVTEGRVPFWLPSNMDGITLGKHIYFRKDVYIPGEAGSVEILGHELVHVEQYGKGMNIFTYTWDFLKNGYSNNKYEVEAYSRGSRMRAGYCSKNRSAAGC
ncbi:DUF4157 domain-containing protein [Vogesella sp. DC21W]|uniref:DUF4157 domain-containing protein n=1 Tax=Vogesella aquatica TaxID=2984206 RepID=A0ABT5J4Q8_9NEIS|nr:DUF4157 domain-containing protein [Vogesella aquatica]MDC7719179.1 DUF4157 domain-containing protein [Vogesella aquatica]